MSLVSCSQGETRQTRVSLDPGSYTVSTGGGTATVTRNPRELTSEPRLISPEVRERVAEQQGEVLKLEAQLQELRLHGRRLARIEVTGLSEEARQALMPGLPVHVGDTLSEQSIEEIGAAVREYGRRVDFSVGWSLTEVEGGEFALRIMARSRR